MAKVSKIAFPILFGDPLKVFEKILGPELEGGFRYVFGYWLWPIGKYVELYWDQEFELSAALVSEPTKGLMENFL